MSRLALDHSYFEHDGGHGLNEGKRYITEYMQSAKHVRRDPCDPQLTLTTLVGVVYPIKIELTNVD